MNRINDIKKLDKQAMDLAYKKWNSIAKPLHSMGKFEEIIIRIAGITRDYKVDISKKCTIVMCADNGVVEEGVTQTDSNVTTVVADAMASGDGNINVLSNCYGSDIFVVDIGMKKSAENNMVINKKIKAGTDNIKLGAAMTREECENAIIVGIDMVKECVSKGYKIIATGEMGIGNTTTSSAIASVLLNREVKEVTGKGAGLDKEGIERKINVIKEAIRVNELDGNKKGDAIEILRRVGGLDIAGMTGVFLGGAIYGVPIVIDGFISAVAAAIAKTIKEDTKDYMISSHVSKEPAAKWMLDYIGTSPVLNAHMCLGEGTGAVMLFPLLDGAIAMYNSVHSFENLSIDQYEEL